MSEGGAAVPDRVVVVGAGLAGLRTVEALRELGYPGRVALLGAEERSPYDRPPLSKAVLRGADPQPLRPSLADLDVDLRLGCPATGLADGVVRTAAGDLAADAVVLATGSVPVRLPGPGLTLRTAEDALRLRAALRRRARLVIVGASWIGAEVATAAAAAGCPVTVVEAAATPLWAPLGATVGAVTEGWWRAAGVDLRCGDLVAAVTDRGVELASGEALAAEVVLVAVGVRPATGWLGLAGPVPVDAALRWRPGVYAVGDCAAFPSGRFAARLQVEHWDEALHAPAVVAANLLGGAAVHDPVPYFWSEQFGRVLQFVGYRGDADEFLWRGDPAGETWAGCWLAGGVLRALVAVGRPREVMAARRAIAAGARVDRDLLGCADTPLKAALSSAG